MTPRWFLALVAAAGFMASCNNSPTTPTDTTQTRQASYFTGSMSPGESAFYSFTVGFTANTEVTLLSLRPNGAVTPALTTPVSIGIGTPAGTGCRTSSTVAVTPGLSPQLVASTAPTIYCVNIADLGLLPYPVAFTIKIFHP